ncbi:MAG: TrfB-related DNA-binding protein [Pseudohongiella sp.]|nr:TrfB-related DNA-binding protein [Pseudohongiella sp.]
MQIKFTISDSEFDQAFSKTRITPRYKEALRDIMVLGKSHLSVSEETGFYKQALNRNVNTVKKQFLKNTDTPDTWTTTTVSLPPNLAHKLRAIKELEMDERLKLKLEVSEQKLS